MKVLVNEATKPTLFIDKKKCVKNIEAMIQKAKANKIEFRPHFKTHQSADIANWFRQRGVNKCTVSSVDMAKYFIQNHWKDLSIAFPVNIREIDDINEIPPEVELNLLVSEIDTMHALNKNLRKDAGIFIKINTGNNRAGIAFDNTGKIDQVIELIRSNNLLEFKGFLNHDGNTYQSRSKDEVVRIFESSVSKLNLLKDRYKTLFPELILSSGDTPSASILDNFNGIDEIRPGNFIFYDLMQYHIGSCKLDDIAISLACPVVEKHKSRNEIVIYGGGVHLSKEVLTINNRNIYGYLINYTKNGWETLPLDNYVKALSQEHGIVKVDNQVFNEIQIGDLIGVLPVHSCMTVNLMKRIVNSTGENFFINR